MIRQSLHTDLRVIGGGIAGVCAALATSRNGAKVILVQDRSGHPSASSSMPSAVANKRVDMFHDLAGLPATVRRFADLSGTTGIATTGIEYDAARSLRPPAP